MSLITKRSLLTRAGWSVLACAAVLAGCGKKEEPPAPAAAAPASASMAAAPASAAPLKIAFAYLGPAGDHGWTYAHDEARKAVEKEDRKSTRLNSSHPRLSRMPSSA